MSLSPLQYAVAAKPAAARIFQTGIAQGNRIAHHRDGRAFSRGLVGLPDQDQHVRTELHLAIVPAREVINRLTHSLAVL